MKPVRLWAACLSAVAVLSVSIPTSGRMPGAVDLAPLASASLTIASAEVESGGSATVPLSTTLDAYTLGAVTVDIQYDPSLVDAAACTADPGGLFDFAYCNESYAADTVRLVAISAYGVTGSPVLAEISFLASGEPGQASPLLLALENFDDPSGTAIPVLVENGQISIAAGGGLPAPTGLLATSVSASEIDLSWTDNSPDETAFHIERSPDGSTNWAEIASVAAATTSFEDTGLACGTPYYYRVRAYRAGDGLYSGYSNTAHDTTWECAGDCFLGIGSALVKEGESASVPLSAALASYALGAVTIEIQYNAAIVDATNCTADPGGVFDMAQCNVDLAGTVLYTAISTSGVSGSPVLADITFQAVGTAGQSSSLLPIPAVFADPAGNAIPLAVEVGAITIWLPTEVLWLPMVLKGSP